MMSFLHNALAQSANAGEKVDVVDADGATSGDFEQRIGNLMNRLGQPKAGSQAPEAQQPAPGKLGAALAELAAVAQQLARVDVMIEQVSEGAPECEEAKKFREISLKALAWSRDMLCQKQARYLADLGATASPSPSPSPTSADQPAPESEEPTEWMGWSKADVEACPEFVPSPQASGGEKGEGFVGGGSLREDLEFLRTCEPDCVLIVRKIKKLGFGSPELLQQHFAQHGEVGQVLVAHSHVKPTAKRPNGRVRPAALGFVVMRDGAGARRALEAGGQQLVLDTVVELSPFDAFEEFECEPLALDKFQ